MLKQVILIMTDTQRIDMLGCYGNENVQTPAIDSIANNGARYTNGYTCTPVCGPARSGLFTGIFPHSNGSWANTQPVGDNIKTIGQRLTDRNIKCGYIGKWHLDGSDYFGLGRCPDGWDKNYWYDMRNYLEELTTEQRIASRNPQTSFESWFNESFTFGYRCTKRALKFIDEHKNKDFFLVISYDEPHEPSLCPKEFIEKYETYILQKNKKNIFDDLKNKPEHHRLWAEKIESMSLDKDKQLPLTKYLLGCNDFIDTQIEKVINKVNKTIPESMLFYTSDHGCHHMSHGLISKGATMYEENINIPFLVQWKKHIKPNQVIDFPVSHIDICPTIMDYFCNHIPKTLNGKSLLNHFKDTSIRPNDYVFSEFGRYEHEHDGFGGFQPIRCAIDGRYKLVINLLVSDEFYDLYMDPEELNNLINTADKSLQQERNRLHNALLNWLNDTRDPFRGYYWHNRPWRNDAPKATWDYTALARKREEDPMYEPRQLQYEDGLELKEAIQKI